MNSNIRRVSILGVALTCGAAWAQRPQDPARLIPVVAALDADSDGALSEAEVNAAPTALIALDADGSETLTAEEIAPRMRGGLGSGRFRPGTGRTGPPDSPGPRSGGPPSGRLWAIPVIAALDADGDGEVSTAETREAPKSLAALDSDGSGRVERAEMLPQRGGPGFGGRRQSPREPGADPPAIPVMTAIDADGNGEVSTAEMRSAAAALRTLDSDGDGSLTASEMAPPRQGSQVAPRRGPPGGVNREPPVIAALDVDFSSDLDPKEIEAAPELLAKLDRDGSGVLTADELMPRGFRPGGAGPGGFRGPGGRGMRGGPREAGGENRSLIRPEDLDPRDGAAVIPDREMFADFSYQGSEVLIDSGLIGLEFVKFIVVDARSDSPTLYFMNTETHRAHPAFMREFGLESGMRGSGDSVTMRGVIVFRPTLLSPSGRTGLYTFEFEPRDSYPYELIRVAHELLTEHSDLMAGNLAYLPLPAAVPRYREEQAQYEAGKLPVILQDQMYEDVSYLPLNIGAGYGRLRLMSVDERPGPRDIVLYETLPNELPRVGGILTATRQTPLSHVNLRAVQDGVPNAYIRGAGEDSNLGGLIGKYVYYRVAEDGFEIREAAVAEVEQHFEMLRPQDDVLLQRDLHAKRIRPLSEVGFADHVSVGVKAANVAELGKLGLGEGVVPAGFAVPFHFYEQFMRHNGFYDRLSSMLADPAFEAATGHRSESLKAFRKAVRDGAAPSWMLEELGQLQAQFRAGQPIRLRSSTNNEDLPGFSGAGLYDSFTHHPDEGHIVKSVKQVYASLWNFRAFEERQFYRINHGSVAMGILVHPNYSGELANGVAVTEDIAYQTGGYGRPKMYYVNVQVGEDLVTNPEADSVPEEILLSTRGRSGDRVVRKSNRADLDEGVLGQEHREELREHMRRIHNRFKVLYDASIEEKFAMEIEFKVTADGRLAVKQARPWVFSDSML